MRDLTKMTPLDWEEEVPVTCMWLGAEDKGKK
jgi:hypothetical protein